MFANSINGIITKAVMAGELLEIKNAAMTVLNQARYVDLKLRQKKKEDRLVERIYSHYRFITGEGRNRKVRQVVFENNVIVKKINGEWRDVSYIEIKLGDISDFSWWGHNWVEVENEVDFYNGISTLLSDFCKSMDNIINNIMD